MSEPYKAFLIPFCRVGVIFLITVAQPILSFTAIYFTSALHMITIKRLKTLFNAFISLTMLITPQESFKKIIPDF